MSTCNMHAWVRLQFCDILVLEGIQIVITAEFPKLVEEYIAPAIHSLVMVPGDVCCLGSETA